MNENTIVEQAESTPAPVTEEVKTEVPVEAAEAPEKVEPESRAEKRIQQLVAKRKEAERETEFWREQASKTVEQVAKPSTTAPTIDQFEQYDDYLVAKAKYEFRAEQQQQDSKQRIEVFNETFQTRINQAAQKDPDILDIVNDRSLPISQPMAVVIKESEQAPDVLRYLSNNRDESRRIAQMNPIAAAREIGKIEYKLSNQPKTEIKKVSQAPEPIKPVESKGAQSVELDKLPMDEYVKRRNQEQYGKRR